MQQHVRILLLRRLGAIAFRVGVGRDVEGIAMQDLADVIANVLRELRIDFVENVLPVEQRPHLADCLVADAGDDAANFLQHRVGGAALVPPVLLRIGQLVADGVDLAALLASQNRARRRLMLHVVDARPDIDERLEHRMNRDVVDALAGDVNFASVADGIAVLGAGADHVLSCQAGSDDLSQDELILAPAKQFFIGLWFCFSKPAPVNTLK